MEPLTSPQSPQQSPQPTAQPASQQPQRPPSKPTDRDRKVRYAFLLLVVVLSVVIYLTQVRDPALPGWGRDLPAAIAEANAAGKNVLLLFTNDTMGQADKDLIVKNLRNERTTVRALGKLQYPLVHLKLKADAEAARKYKVDSAPTLLLLGRDGNEIKRYAGFLSDLRLCEDFLGLKEW